MMVSIKKSVIFSAISLLIYFNIVHWQSAAIGWLLLIFYFLSYGKDGQVILRKFFGVGARGWRGKLLGAFLVLFVLGLLFAMIIVFYKLTAPIIALVFFLNGILFSSARQFAEKASREFGNEEGIVEPVIVEESPSPAIKFFLYFVLVGAAWYFLSRFQSGEAIFSPWQIIHPYYIYFFFASTALLGFLIFTRLKTATILFLLIIQTFLLHAYLPLSHELFYGVDGWRHLAVEEKILREESVLSNTFLDWPLTRIQSVDWGEFSYSQLRGISVVFSRVLSVDLIKINIWLLPIVWSIVCPLLLFELGRVLGWKKQEALFLAWLGFLPFAFQAGGSFTLPVNFGFLGFLLSVILLAGRIKNRRPEQVWTLALLGIGSFFGYLLFFILFWLGWGVAEALHYFASKKPFRALAIILPLGLFIPALELVAKYSFWNPNFNWWISLKQFIGNFLGIYIASGPRPHDILTGNIIFNQMPAYAFTPNVFTAWRWWIVLFLVAFFILAAVGWARFWKSGNAERFLAVFGAAILGSYIFSRYILVGENILGRRLDIVLALFFILFAQKGIIFLTRVFSTPHSALGIFALVVCFSALISASYSLGPDAPVVGVDEYESAQYIWSKEWVADRHCVLASTNALLVLEAVSAREIVGGGFPMRAYFSQPERVEFYSRIVAEPKSEILAEAAGRIGVDHCWILADNKTVESLRPSLTEVKFFGKMGIGLYKKIFNF